jgi:hypothetical protein
MALFKSIGEPAITAGTMFPGTIVPIPLELPGSHPITMMQAHMAVDLRSTLQIGKGQWGHDA